MRDSAWERINLPVIKITKDQSSRNTGPRLSLSFLKGEALTISFVFPLPSKAPFPFHSLPDLLLPPLWWTPLHDNVSSLEQSNLLLSITSKIRFSLLGPICLRKLLMTVRLIARGKLHRMRWLDSKEVAFAYQDWQISLYSKFLDKTPPLDFVKLFLPKLYSHLTGYQIVDLARGFFYLKCHLVKAIKSSLC